MIVRDLWRKFKVKPKDKQLVSVQGMDYYSFIFYFKY